MWSIVSAGRISGQWAGYVVLIGRSHFVPLRQPRSGEYSERIVGELSYQVQIERLAGGSPDDGSSCDVAVTAILVRDDDNPVDDQAIQVQIEGIVVGYLTRASARLYRHWIVGGWDRGERDAT